MTPTEVSKFFKPDIWGLGLSINGLLSHLEVEVFENFCGDDVIPLQESLFKSVPNSPTAFHL
jgi:hypothetical protein